jgi:hypothetical protein
MLIYNYNALNNYFTGAIQDIPDGSGIPVCWTDEPVPTIPAGEWARYNNPGWVITDVPPPIPPEPASEPLVQVNEPPAPSTGETPTVI